MEIASAQAGLDDFGDVPFEQALEVLSEALAREARLEGGRIAETIGTLAGTLVKRLKLVEDRKQNPQIAEEKIEAPIIIVGLPRTGSTHLHGLMGVVNGLRVPMFWELIAPSPPPEASTYDRDPRIAQAQAITDQMPSDFLRRHAVAANRPEQCNLIYDWSFINQALLASYDIPSYRDWIYDVDYQPAYEAHRRMLQQLQWRTPGRWVLKYPKHLMTLDALLDAYPDAKLVWTHRDPAAVLPSVCSLTGYMRSPTPGYDSARFGREWIALEELILLRGMKTRDRMKDADARIYDLHFSDLMSDPVAAVGGICSKFDIPFDAESQRRVGQFITDHPRTEHGEHRYTAEEYGLTKEGLRRRFDFYIDRYNVEVR